MFPYFLLGPDDQQDTNAIDSLVEKRLIGILVSDYGLAKSAVDVNGRGMDCYYTLKAAFAQVFMSPIDLNVQEINRIAGATEQYYDQHQAQQKTYVNSQLEPLGQFCDNGGLNKIGTMFDALTAQLLRPPADKRTINAGIDALCVPTRAVNDGVVRKEYLRQ